MAKKQVAATPPALKAAPSAPQVEEFIIEENVPIPQRSKGKYPIDMLKVGQSFLVRCLEADMKKTKASLGAAARRVTAASDGVKQFVVLDRPEEGGVRLWRGQDDDEGQEQPQEEAPPQGEVVHTFPSIG